MKNTTSTLNPRIVRGFIYLQLVVFTTIVVCMFVLSSAADPLARCHQFSRELVQRRVTKDSLIRELGEPLSRTPLSSVSEVWSFRNPLREGLPLKATVATNEENVLLIECPKWKDIAGRGGA